MYADYLKEREGKTYTDLKFGFIVYEVEGHIFYLSDVYIKPESRECRRTRDVMKYVNNLAKEYNCTKIVTTCSDFDNNLERSKKVIEANGFKFLKKEHQLHIYEKEII